MDPLTPTPPGDHDAVKLRQAETGSDSAAVPRRGEAPELGTAETGIVRQTLVDPSVDDLPSRIGLDMRLQRTVRRWPQARRDLEAALELAERLEDASRAVDVLGELVLLADEERDTSAAKAWLAAIRGKLARLEDQPRRRALRWRLEGLVALRGDELGRALRLDPNASDEHAREAGGLVREAAQAFAAAGFTERVVEIDALLEACGPSCAPIPPSSTDPQREAERP